MFFKAFSSITVASWDLGTFDLKDHTYEPECSVIPATRAILHNSWVFLFIYFYNVFLQSATNCELLYLSANIFGRISMVYTIPYALLKMRMKLST